MYSRQDVIDKLLSEPSTDTNMGTSSSASSDVEPRNLIFRQRHWNNAEQFIEDNLREVYEKLNQLEKQIWGKLIVMESNRRTAKAYLRHPLITIDGSDAEFDGLRLGLAHFENGNREPVAYEIFRDVFQGVKIKVDPEGNVWAKRACPGPVLLKPLYRNRANDVFVIDQRPVKVFDIKRFKEVLIRELNVPQPDRRKLEKCCLICLKFVVDHPDLLRTPCWIVIIHLVAVELLNILIPKGPKEGFYFEREFIFDRGYKISNVSKNPSGTLRNVLLQLSNNEFSSPSSSFAPSPIPGEVARPGVVPQPRQPERKVWLARPQLPDHMQKRQNQHHSQLAHDFPLLQTPIPSRSLRPPPIPLRTTPEQWDRLPSSRIVFRPSERCFSMTDLRETSPTATVLCHTPSTTALLHRRPETPSANRVFSVEALDGFERQHLYRSARAKPNSTMVYKSDRGQLQKWRSQDSGIASGSGSYGRK